MEDKGEIVRWVKAVIDAYVKNRKVIPVPEDLSEALTGRRAGAFVSIHTVDHRLRGCIGTIEPTQSSLALELRSNAIAAATRDPRFPPTEPEELDHLTISADVLEAPERVKDMSELDPKEYGVIVKSGFRKGLLLPDLEGVETVEAQVAIAKRKAGIEEDEPVTVYRFRVTRYH
jgi:hypothetical protein